MGTTAHPRPLEALLPEADRQFTICNACRYCEGYCAVFPEMEKLEGFDDGSLSYLANLCHDCRGCYQACMYTEPHEFRIDIPSLMQEAREASWRRYARPRRLAPLFHGGARGVFVATLAGTALALLVAVLAGGLRSLFVTGAPSGSFYAVVPHAVMVGVFGSLTVLIVGIVGYGVVLFWREAGLDARRALSPRLWTAALRDAATLRNLRGGGGECYFPEPHTPTAARRVWHTLVAYGFGAAFLSTVIAAFQENVLGHESPFPYLSAPVLFGSVGGVAMIVGCAGMIAGRVAERDLKRRGGSNPALSIGFLASLLSVSLTGMLLVALRETAAMGVLLLLHIGTVFALYVTAPYGRFVHAAYRLAALLVKETRSHA